MPARARALRVRWVHKAFRAVTLTGAVLAAQAHAAEPALREVNPAPSFDSLFRTPEAQSQRATSAEPFTLSRFRNVDHNDLEVSSFLASRTRRDAADYRVYLGLGYKRELGDASRLTSRAFYGAGTYDGMNPGGIALPEEVRASANAPGGWVGADWQLESRLSERHTFYAGVEYRQRLGFAMLDLNEFLGRASTLTYGAQPARKVGFVTRNQLALSNDLSLKVRMRYDDDPSATRRSIDPRVELVYRPAQSTTVTALFDQTAHAPLSQARAYHPWASTTDESDRIRNYELAYEKALSQRDRVRVSAYRYDADGLLTPMTDAGTAMASVSAANIDTRGFEVGMERNASGGARARISYAWQETTDWLAGASQGSLGQHLTRLNVDIPILPNRLSTNFELQRLDVVGALAGDENREYVIGNFTLASGALATDTRVSLGMHNVFGARETGNGARLLSFIPPDGRSVRLDLKRQL